MKKKTQQQQQSREELQEEPRQKTRRGRFWEWTGFGEKTAWDWMQLLIVPVVLAIGGLLFNMAQSTQQQQIEDRRTQGQLAAEEQRAQEDALQGYLSDMRSLILDRNLLSSKEGDEVRTIARTRTLTVLRRVNAARKRSVMQFLAETGLASSTSKNAEHLGSTGSKVGTNVQQIVILSEAPLSGVDLRAIDLPQAHLAVADLSGADWERADLTQVELVGANLSRAYLSGTTLTGASMSAGTNLTNADLTDANLSGADLTNADLTNANLSGANLEGAKGVGAEELEAQAQSLAGVTMPDGTKHD